MGRYQLLCATIVMGMLAAPLSAQQNATPAAPPQTQQTQQGAATETQTLHILSGRSVIVNTQARMKRILVSNPEILATETVTPTQLVITARKPGNASLILWDETGMSRIFDVFSDVDVAGLRSALAQAFPNENIQVEAEQGKIILSGTPTSSGVADEMVKTAGLYSKEVVNSMTVPVPVRGRQIMLKVKFAEVDRTKLTAFGINFLSTGAGNTPGTISTQQFAPLGLGGGQGGGSTGSIKGTIPGNNTGTSTSFAVNDLLNIFLFRPDLNFGATIKALQSNNVLQILAEPNLMAMNGQPARFLAGGEFPFPVVQGGAAVGAVTVQFRPFGVRLDFTGTIEDGDIVRLKVSPEVSSLDFANALQISGFTVPAISTRRAETEIELKNGQSFGIAGLLDQRTTAQFNKIPGIGDIPVLGQLFRSRSVNRANTELLVFVTPVIVDPLSGVTPPTTEPSGPIKNLDIPSFDKGVTDKKETGKAATNKQ